MPKNVTGLPIASRAGKFGRVPGAEIALVPTTMNQTLIPWSILSSNIAVSRDADGWNLADIGDTPEKPRTFIVNVAFVSPFSFPPVVHLGLTGFDADQRDSSRISMKSEHVTETGFQAAITTWSTTRVYAVEFNWLAIGA